MKRFSFLLLQGIFFFLPLLSSGQKTFELNPCEVFKNDFNTQKTDLLNAYINKYQNSSESKILADLYSSRALLIMLQNYRDKSKSVSFRDSIFQAARRDINLSIKSIGDSNLEIEYIHRRYQIFEFVRNHYPEYTSDLKDLIEIGFKEVKIGMSISLITKYDGQFWLGGEVSIPTLWQKRNQLKNGYGDIFFRNRNMIASTFNFGMVKNLDNDWLEWSASLFKVEAPIYLDILRVGQLRTTESNHFFYRPTIGFGYSMFTLSYGYNVFFKKGIVPANVARHVVNFRVRYMI